MKASSAIHDTSFHAVNSWLLHYTRLTSEMKIDYFNSVLCDSSANSECSVYEAISL